MWRSHTALTVKSCSSLLQRHHPCSQNDVLVLQPVVYLNLCWGQPTLRSMGITSPADTRFPKIALKKMPRWWQEFISHHQSGQGQERLEPTSYHQEPSPRNGAGLILPVTGEFPCTCSPGARHLPTASGSRPSSAALQVDPAPQGVGWVINQCPQQDPRTGGDRSWLRDRHAHVYKRLSEILKCM